MLVYWSIETVRVHNYQIIKQELMLQDEILNGRFLYVIFLLKLVTKFSHNDTEYTIY